MKYNKRNELNVLSLMGFGFIMLLSCEEFREDSCLIRCFIL